MFLVNTMTNVQLEQIQRVEIITSLGVTVVMATAIFLDKNTLQKMQM